MEASFCLRRLPDRRSIRHGRLDMVLGVGRAEAGQYNLDFASPRAAQEASIIECHPKRSPAIQLVWTPRSAARAGESAGAEYAGFDINAETRPRKVMLAVWRGTCSPRSWRRPRHSAKTNNCHRHREDQRCPRFPRSCRWWLHGALPHRGHNGHRSILFRETRSGPPSGNTRRIRPFRERVGKVSW